MNALGEAFVSANNQLDAVATARALDLMSACDGVWVRLKWAQSRDPEIYMLASLPLEMNVFDCDDCC